MFKIFVCLSLVTTTEIAGASLGPCSKLIYENNSALNMVNFLREYEGKFELGSCSIEIQVCDPSNMDVEGNGNIAADMLVIDREGFQRYIPFFISDQKSDWSKQVAFQSYWALGYKFKDKNFDPETGSNENWKVALVKTNDASSLSFAEFRYSSEVEKINDVDKKLIVCGTKREKFYKDHPLLSRLYSMKWWLSQAGTK